MNEITSFRKAENLKDIKKGVFSKKEKEDILRK